MQVILQAIAYCILDIATSKFIFFVLSHEI